MNQMKKILYISVGCILLLSSFQVIASPDKNMVYLETEKNMPINSGEILDQSQEIFTNKAYIGTLPSQYYDTIQSYQSFVPQVDTLTRVEILMARDPYFTPAKNANLVIRDELDGEDLTMASVSYTEIFENFRWIDFDFPDIRVTAGDLYYFICYVDLEPHGDTLYKWGYSYDDPYPYGDTGDSFDGGNTWIYPYNNSDKCFRTYGIPDLGIYDIKGGFGKVSADITNNLDYAIDDIDCTITVQGGIFNRINVESNFTIDSLDTGESFTISSDDFIFGLGSVDIKITVECDEIGEFSRTKNGFIILFLVL